MHRIWLHFALMLCFHYSIVAQSNIDNKKYILLDFISKDVSCHGGNDGSVTVMPVDDTNATYHYMWSDNNIGDTPTATNLSAGQYSVTVSDDTGCSSSLVFRIAEPSPITANITGNTNLCFRDITSLNVNASGGFPPYTYEWNTGNTNNILGNISDAGNYSVTVTDANNCTQVSNINITVSEPITLRFDVTQTTCIGDNNGTIVPVIEGGVEPFVYTWSTGDAIANLNGLSPGNYRLTVTDNFGCTKAATAEIVEAVPFSITANTTPASCFGYEDGSIAINTSDAGTYTYRWNNPDFDDLNTLNNIAAGTYHLSVSNESGCTIDTSFIIAQPDSMLIELQGDDFVCPNTPIGSITASVIGPNAPFDFNWNTGINNATLSDLDADTYTLTVTNSNNCSQMITHTISTSSPVNVNFIQQDINCAGQNNGSLSILALGGTPPYQLDWSNGIQNETAIQNLSAGDYALTITDANACEYTNMTTIIEPDSMSFMTNITPVRCLGEATGSIEINANRTDYTYIWNGNPDNNMATISDLTAGAYHLQLSNQQGCTIDTTFILAPPSGIELDISGTEFLCHGSAEGAITATVSGENEPFQLLWSTGDTTNTISALLPATYQLSITDNYGCNHTTAFEIVSSPEITTAFETTDIECAGQNNGKASVVINGGQAPYELLWSTGDNSPNIYDLAPANYTLNITDSYGCTHSDTVAIVEANPIFVTLDPQDISCFGERDGIIDIDANGGSGNFRYSLDGRNFYPSNQFFNLTSKYYQAFAKDDSGCVGHSDSTYIEEPTKLEIVLDKDMTIQWGEEVPLYPEIYGGTGDISYHWTTGDTSSISCMNCLQPMIAARSDIYYELIAVDANGCTATRGIYFFVENDKSLYVPNVFSPNGDGINDIVTVYGKYGARVNTFQIFNRWGEQVFESKDFPVNDLLKGWDGKFKGRYLNPNVFVWKAELIFPDGDIREFFGDLTLIR